MKRNESSQTNVMIDRFFGRLRNSAFVLVGFLIATIMFADRRASFWTQADSAGIAPPQGGPLTPILLVVLVIVVNALFVMSETAIGLLRPVHVRHMREKHAKKSEKLQSLVDRRTGLLATSRLGTYSCLLALVMLAFLLAPGLMDRMEWSGYGMLLLAAFLIMIPIGVINLIAELIAKSLATLHPHGFGAALQPFIVGTSYLFWIPEKIITAAAGVITARYGGRASFVVENQAEEEIKTLVETAQETGEIEHEERALLHSVFEFTDTVAREVMTPRVDMDAVPVNSEPAEVLKVIQESGHSRIPLFEDTDDQIVGVIHAKDLFVELLSGKKPDLRSIMRVPLFVPENKNLHELLAEMRGNRSQLAIVQDEFGGTAGIVTIEDIVEELVGDIVDEYDEEEPEVVAVEDYWLVEGKTHLDDVNAQVGSALESDEFDTIGGYVFGLFGRQPAEGESIIADHYRFTVEETDGRRISKLKLEVCEELDTADLEEEQV